MKNLAAAARRQEDVDDSEWQIEIATCKSVFSDADVYPPQSVAYEFHIHSLPRIHAFFNASRMQ